MARNNVAPTKTNLLKLKDQIKFATEGYDLLDQKKNILVVELLMLVDQTVEFQSKIETSLKDAFKYLEEAVLDSGRLLVFNLSKAVNIETNIEIKSRKVMGVQLPVVNTKFSEHDPYYSPYQNSYWIDRAQIKFKEALKAMGRLAELKISVIRLAEEVKKTIRKVNALEKIAIPELKDTIEYIEGRLEENERDMFILMKMVKKKLEKKAGTSGQNNK